MGDVEEAAEVRVLVAALLGSSVFALAVEGREAGLWPDDGESGAVLGAALRLVAGERLCNSYMER